MGSSTRRRNSTVSRKIGSAIESGTIRNRGEGIGNSVGTIMKRSNNIIRRSIADKLSDETLIQSVIGITNTLKKFNNGLYSEERSRLGKAEFVEYLVDEANLKRESDRVSLKVILRDSMQGNSNFVEVMKVVRDFTVLVIGKIFRSFTLEELSEQLQLEIDEDIVEAEIHENLDQKISDKFDQSKSVDMSLSEDLVNDAKKNLKLFDKILKEVF